ncbi:nucleoside-diphosphate sugar epimerase [Amycolatopsis antarctica]|uniref:Nucleoside-diphosphate sugar epimerase n=1 Tax=Amycolatopsis antarctica TaxID=1854586 RepID=A0A263CWF4_9PSEU|nr:NAD(P)H-binding protein [Amycolatopsis antarctica]OZM70462.1 nucleoside-diphosphate sugar epimerase [Amycolatopsis antarctica]
MTEARTILVTGATGNVGRSLVTGLAERGVRVRALVRDPAAAALPDGVTAVCGDLTDPATVAEAAHGVDAAFLLWPLITDKGAPAVLDAIGSHTRRLVYLSSSGVRDDLERQQDPINQFHADLERHIRERGFDATFLRAGGFAANTLGWAESVREQGRVREPFGRAHRALIHERDIAEVAVRALTGDGHTGATYVLTGPESQTTAERVRVLGETLGTEVRFEEVPRDRARAEMLAQGWPEHVADGMLAAYRDMEAAPDPVTGTVAEITGQPARTFARWVTDHAADFRAPSTVD